MNSPEATAPRFHLLSATGLISTHRAYTLDELQERCFVSRVSLKNVRGEDLVQQVLALQIEREEKEVSFDPVHKI